MAVVIVSINETFIACGAGIFGGGEDVDRFGGLCAVKVPDVDLAVVRAAVDVSSVGRALWRKVAADEGF